MLPIQIQPESVEDIKVWAMTKGLESMEDFIFACDRCHCKRACGHCFIPKAWALERLQNYESLDVVRFAEDRKSFFLYIFAIPSSSGGWDCRTTDQEHAFQINLGVLHERDESEKECKFGEPSRQAPRLDGVNDVI